MRAALNRILFWIFVVPLMLAGAAIGPLSVLSEGQTLGRILGAVAWIAIWVFAGVFVYRSSRKPLPEKPLHTVERTPPQARSDARLSQARLEGRLAQIMKGLSAWMLLPMMLCVWLWQRGPYWRPLSILLFPIGVVVLPLYGVFQLLSVTFTTSLHETVGTRLSVAEEGLELSGRGQQPRALPWSEVATLQIRTGRQVADPRITITDVRCYELALRSGEKLVVDFADETELLAACRQHDVEVLESAGP